MSAVWVQTSTFGFVSIVLAETQPGSGVADREKLMIRARRREHLELLQREHPTLAEFAITQTLGYDYPWRIAPVPKALVAAAVAEAVLAISYRNFKSACATKPELGPRYEPLLHEVWSVLRRLQLDA